MFLTFFVGFLEYHHKCYEIQPCRPLSESFEGGLSAGSTPWARPPDSFGSYVLIIQPRRRVWNPTSRRNAHPPPLLFHHTPQSVHPGHLPPNTNASVWIILVYLFKGQYYRNETWIYTEQNYKCNTFVFHELNSRSVGLLKSSQCFGKSCILAEFCLYWYLWAWLSVDLNDAVC